MRLRYGVRDLKGNVPCANLREWNAASNTFRAIANGQVISDCREQKLVWRDITNYVASVSAIPDYIFSSNP
jgi:hypothetical protein